MEAMGRTAPDLMTAAFLSMQPPSAIVAFAREVGGGFITSFSQQFFLDNCFNNKVHLRYPSSQSYVKRVVKAIILAAESDGYEVLENLYDLHLLFLDVDQSLPLAERCYTTFTFNIPESAKSNLAQNLGEEVASQLIGTKLLTLRVSLNILDGDTGYSVWPAGLFLAQVLLSHPQLVHGKSCLELGSGTGICGIWLSMLAPSKAILTDGALSTLVNMRHNLETNGIPICENKARQEIRKGETLVSNSSCFDQAVILKQNDTEFLNFSSQSRVDCRQLLWETTSEAELLSFGSEVIIGADLVYDPTIVPHLVRALAVMLQKRSSKRGFSDKGRNFKAEDADVLTPVAYITSALRNLTTLHLFFQLAEKTGLDVTDVTVSLMPLRILPDIYGLDRSEIRLYKIHRLIESTDIVSLGRLVCYAQECTLSKLLAIFTGLGLSSESRMSKSNLNIPMRDEWLTTRDRSKEAQAFSRFAEILQSRSSCAR